MSDAPKCEHRRVRRGLDVAGTHEVWQCLECKRILTLAELGALGPATTTKFVLK